MKGQQTLPRELRKRAEKFFGVSFSDLEVTADERVAELGARAFAYGRRIYLSPCCTDFERPEHLALLGHELAHVVQQMEGRVPATTCLGGLPLNDDPRLEREADALGVRFATGGPGLSRRPRPCPPVEPVVQRTVITGGVLLQPPDPPNPLGPKVQQVLSLIDGGQEWLAWAISEPRETFRFPDSAALLEGIQIGLHGSPLMLLQRLGLWVSPKKLLVLPDDVLSAILKWEQQGGSGSQRNALNKTLRNHELWPQKAFKPAFEFLADTGVSDEPVFQIMSLIDQLQLLKFVDSPWLGLDSAQMLRGAARFGVEYADNPAEFVDYTALFLVVAHRLGLKDPKVAGNAAGGVLASMQPDLPGYLRGLSFSEAPSPGELERNLVQWIGSGRLLGFQRVSTAAEQIYRQSGLRQETGAAMRTIIDRYMVEASQFLAAHRPDPGVMLQNGATWFYQVQGDGGEAVLWLSSDGCLTLKSYTPASSDKPKARRRQSTGKLEGISDEKQKEDP